MISSGCMFVGERLASITANAPREAGVCSDDRPAKVVGGDAFDRRTVDFDDADQCTAQPWRRPDGSSAIENAERR